MKIFNIKHEPHNDRLCRVVMNINAGKRIRLSRYDDEYPEADDMLYDITEWYRETFNIRIGKTYVDYSEISFCIPKRRHRSIIALKLRFQ